MWYSAFSERSPSSRAVLIRAAISTRAGPSSCSISARSFSIPSEVIGSCSISGDYRPSGDREGKSTMGAKLTTREHLRLYPDVLEPRSGQTLAMLMRTRWLVLSIALTIVCLLLASAAAGQAGREVAHGTSPAGVPWHIYAQRHAG